MDQKTNDAKFQIQHNYMVVRVCQKRICRSTAECTVRMDIGSEAFKRAFEPNRNAVTTAVKRTSKKTKTESSESKSHEEEMEQ